MERGSVDEVNSRKTMGGLAARLGAAEVVAGYLRFGETWFRQLAQVTNAGLKAADVKVDAKVMQPTN